MTELKPENIELQNKIMEGANRVYEKLLIATAERNENLVIADKDGNMMQVPAQELLSQMSKNGNFGKK